MYINWYQKAKIQQEAGMKENISSLLLSALLSVMGGSTVADAAQQHNVNQQELQKALANPEVVKTLNQEYSGQNNQSKPSQQVESPYQKVKKQIDLTNSRPWTGIVVHHSDSPEWTKLEDIDRWHKEKGWDGVGYHFVIEADGTVRKARPLSNVGAHAKSGKAQSRNSSHIGICLVGKEKFNPEQLRSLERLLYWLSQAYNIESVERHHEQCPGPGINVENYDEVVHRMETQ